MLLDMADKLISTCDTSLRNQPGLNPYARYPERETYTESETYQREDGSTYTRTRGVSRWGGVFSVDAWEVVK